LRSEGMPERSEPPARQAPLALLVHPDRRARSAQQAQPVLRV
jgi:hypothetical protein